MARVDIFSATDLSPLVSHRYSEGDGGTDAGCVTVGGRRVLYAAGFSWHEKDNVIVRWDAVDFKSCQYIPVKTRTLVRFIAALPDGGITCISLNGDMYVLDGKREGGLRQDTRCRSLQPQDVLITPDASVVM